MKVAALVAVALVAACGVPEDPARAELRGRLKQPGTLSERDLARTLDEVARAVEGKRVQIVQSGTAHELTDRTEREVVLGMLVNRTGIYDEGLRTEGGATVRVLNAPGLSQHPEYSAARKLLVDVETFAPRRFEFRYEFPGMGDYDLDLEIIE